MLSSPWLMLLVENMVEMFAGVVQSEDVSATGLA